MLNLRQPAGLWQDSIRHYFNFPVRFDQAEDGLLAPSSLLRDYRLAQAQKYLKQPTLDIESISLKLGFQDRHAFSHAFKQWTGFSPMAWRQQTAASQNTGG